MSTSSVLQNKKSRGLSNPLIEIQSSRIGLVITSSLLHDILHRKVCSYIDKMTERSISTANIKNVKSCVVWT